MAVLPASYVLPFRSEREPPVGFVRYVNALTEHVEVVLVDGSPAPVFAAIDACCDPLVRHIRPDRDLDGLANGKVRGVLTGLRAATCDRIVVADDDVRYSTAALASIVASLDDAEVVRPQNYFAPLPWHALLDTARTLINRTTGGDWPGTIAVRRAALMPDGYDGNALFENLELVRTVQAGGGRARYRPDLMVRRSRLRPGISGVSGSARPTTSSRVRGASSRRWLSCRRSPRCCGCAADELQRERWC